MTKETFNDCLLKIRTGDKHATEAIYNEYYEKFKFTAMFILHSESLSEDAASFALCKIFENAVSNKILSVEYPSSYMYKTIRNTAFDILKAERKFVSLDDVKEPFVSIENKILNRVSVCDAIAKLPPTDFRIVEMFYLYRFKIKDIVEELELPEGTVKWRLKQCRKKLRKYLKEK